MRNEVGNFFPPLSKWSKQELELMVKPSASLKCYSEFARPTTQEPESKGFLNLRYYYIAPSHSKFLKWYMVREAVYGLGQNPTAASPQPPDKSAGFSNSKSQCFPGSADKFMAALGAPQSSRKGFWHS